LKPIHPRRTETDKKDQNRTVLNISKNEPLKTRLVINGRRNNTIKANAKVITPPSLLGIERKIA
jgi:hypothetical protein